MKEKELQAGEALRRLLEKVPILQIKSINAEHESAKRIPIDGFRQTEIQFKQTKK